MEASLKQRLVGAAVLVALGVIFIPMLLERGDDDARLTVSMEIPPRPGVSFEDRLKNPPPLRQEPVQAIEEAIEPVKQARQAESVVSKPAGPAEKPAASAVESPASPQTATSPKTTVKPAVKQVSKPALTSGGEQWIVQVGSFSQETNAKGLRDKLKKSGFDAFVETAKTPAGAVYRVRIGPLGTRDDAEKLAARVKAAGDYKPIVASYP